MDNADKLMVFLLLVHVIAGTAVILMEIREHFSFVVEPGKRERLVLQGLRGNLKVLSPGLHFMFLFKVLTRIDLNRKPIRVEKQEIRASNGVVLLIDYRFDAIAGRAVDDKGEVIGDPNHEGGVTDDAVIRAATLIDFQDYLKIMQDHAAAIVERVCGGLQSDYLLRPSEYGTTARKLYVLIARKVERQLNITVGPLGLACLSFRVTNLVPKSADLQARIEQKEKAKLAGEAAKVLTDIADERGDHLTTQEAVALTEPNPNRSVAAIIAAALRGAAKDTVESLRHESDAAGDASKGPKK